MPPALMIVAVLGHVASLAVLVYWSIGLSRLAATARRATARAGLDLPLPHPPPRVGVVVPAHNEAQVIGRLIESLRVQDYPAFRVVLSLDRCTDDTSVVARRSIGGDPRFEIVPVESCPDGWAGKVHAVWRGLRDGTGAGNDEILVFADADTVFAPGCLRAAVALMADRGLDLLSLLSTLTHDRWFELLAQPAASIETLTQYPVGRASRAKRRRAFANGQFMMFRREAYESVGGHAAARDELLEDMALARRIAEADRPAGVFLADGLLHCRMYASWREFRRGWTRIYIELARRSPGRLFRCAARVLAFGTLLPLVALANVIGGLLVMERADGMGPGWGSPWLWGATGVVGGSAALTVMSVVLMRAYRIGRAPVWTFPGYAIGSVIVAAVLAGAGRLVRTGRAVEWGGRRYVRPPAGCS